MTRRSWIPTQPGDSWTSLPPAQSRSSRRQGVRRSSAGETGHKLKKRNFSWSASQNSLAYIYKLLSLSCSCVVPETLGRLPEESDTPMYIFLQNYTAARGQSSGIMMLLQWDYVCLCVFSLFVGECRKIFPWVGRRSLRKLPHGGGSLRGEDQRDWLDVASSSPSVVKSAPSLV